MTLTGTNFHAHLNLSFSFYLVKSSKEQALGPEHPETAMTQWALAVLHEKQGQYNHAEPLYRQALAVMEKVKPWLVLVNTLSQGVSLPLKRYFS